MFYDFGKTFAQKQLEQNGRDYESEHLRRVLAEAEIELLKERLRVAEASKPGATNDL